MSRSGGSVSQGRITDTSSGLSLEVTKVGSRLSGGLGVRNGIVFSGGNTLSGPGGIGDFSVSQLDRLGSSEPIIRTDRIFSLEFVVIS